MQRLIDETIGVGSTVWFTGNSTHGRQYVKIESISDDGTYTVSGGLDKDETFDTVAKKLIVTQKTESLTKLDKFLEANGSTKRNFSLSLDELLAG